MGCLGNVMKVNNETTATEGSFTPTLSFATPGDLSVSYTSQNGFFVKVGRVVFFSLQVAGTPTYTTASGQVRIGGLPFIISSDANWYAQFVLNSNATWATNVTQGLAVAIAGTNTLGLQGEGSGTALSSFATAQFPTATARDVRITGFFIAIN